MNKDAKIQETVTDIVGASGGTDAQDLSDEERAKKVQNLDEKLSVNSLGGHWQHRKPIARLQPFLWRWDDIYSGLIEAGEVVRLGADTMRRTVQLINPVLKEGERRATSRTIQMSVQLLKPGESARAHRHTAQAIRFVVAGHGAYTTVEGERFDMEPNDLILTPGWTWHDHFNAAYDEVIWLDGLDIPLAQYLDAQFQVNYPEDSQMLSVPSGTSRAKLSPTRLKSPNGIEREYPPYRYAWEDTLPVLHKLLESRDEYLDSYDGLILQYVNPLSGGSTLPTINCTVQLLPPGMMTESHKHTGTSIYHVINGIGEVRLAADDKLRWVQHDCFVIPPWTEHSFANLSSDSEAILFAMSDRPVLDALGLYREEKC